MAFCSFSCIIRWEGATQALSTMNHACLIFLDQMWTNSGSSCKTILLGQIGRASNGRLHDMMSSKHSCSVYWESPSC